MSFLIYVGAGLFGFVAAQILTENLFFQTVGGLSLMLVFACADYFVTHSNFRNKDKK